MYPKQTELRLRICLLVRRNFLGRRFEGLKTVNVFVARHVNELSRSIPRVSLNCPLSNTGHRAPFFETTLVSLNQKIPFKLQPQ